MSERCFWCNADAEEAARRHEGPHATWCLRFRREQRGGRIIEGPFGRYFIPDPPPLPEPPRD